MCVVHCTTRCGFARVSRGVVLDVFECVGDTFHVFVSGGTRAGVFNIAVL